VENTNIRLVKDLMQMDKPSWNTKIIESMLLPIDKACIEQIPLINITKEYELMWMHELNGIYSVCNGYLGKRGITCSPSLMFLCHVLI